MAEHYYTIKDIEEMTGIPATAIRFYDKRGLLVFVKRSPNGMRIFTDRDVEKIRLIQLLRNLDMPVNVISRYIGLVQQGDASRPERRRMIASHIAELEDQLRALQEAVEAAKCVEAALADKDAALPPRKILGCLRNWSIFSPENRLPLLFHTAGALSGSLRSPPFPCGEGFDTKIPLSSIQPPPLRGTSFHRKEGVSTRAPSLGRGCRAQRGGVGFLFCGEAASSLPSPSGKGDRVSGG